MTVASMSQVIQATARHYRLSVDELVGERRHRRFARPRQVAMYLGKTLAPRSLNQVARHFGGRDHTTVLHAVRRIGELIEEDRLIAYDVEALTRQLQGANP